MARPRSAGSSAAFVNAVVAEVLNEKPGSERRTPPRPKFSRNRKVVKFGQPRHLGPENRNAHHASDLAALFDVEPYHRNEVTKNQLDHLRNRIDTEGGPAVAKSLGVCELVMYKVCAGFGHKLQIKTSGKIREYLR